MIAAAIILLLSAQAPEAAATPAPDADAGKRVCKKLVPTGSIMGKRICLTKSDWAKFNQDNAQNAEDALRRRTAGTCQSKCPW